MQTERLILRMVRPSDLESLIEYAGDYQVADMMNGSIPHPYTIETAMKWIQKHEQDCTTSSVISWAITDKSSHRLIGSTQLRMDTSRQTARLSYWLGRPFWNQGLGTEAVQKVIEFGFNELRLTMIGAEHFHRNPASGKILQKLGFQYIGSEERRENLANRMEVLDQYALTCKEYLRMRAKRSSGTPS